MLDFFKEDEDGELRAVDQVFYSEDKQWEWLDEHGFVFIDENNRHKMFVSNTVRLSGWGGFIAVTSQIWDEEAEWEKRNIYKIRFYNCINDAVYAYKN